MQKVTRLLASKLVVAILLGGSAFGAGASGQAGSGEEKARAVLQGAVDELGGREKLAGMQKWYLEGKGRENLSAEMQGAAAERATWRPHEEKVAADLGALAVAWERRTPRVDNTLRWRRMIFQAESFGFADWNGNFGAVRKRANAEGYRRGMARRFPHVLLLEALTRATRMSWKEADARGADVIEVELPDAARMTLHISRKPALLRRVEFLAHLPGRGDVQVAWEWAGWKRDAQLGYVPASHRVSIAGVLFQEVEYSRYSAARPEITAEMMTVPQRLLAPASAAMSTPSANAPATEPLAPAPPPATGMVAPGVLVERVGGFVVMFVEFADFVVAFEAPEVHPGFEVIAAQAPPTKLTADAIARAQKAFPGKPVRYAVISHHHSDHMGGVRALAAAGITIVAAAGDAAAAQKAIFAPHTVTADGFEPENAKVVIEKVAPGQRHQITDGKRTLEAINVGKNPHTDENLFLWLPAERILIQGDLFYYQEGDAFPPPGRETMTAYFSRWLQERGIEPVAIYGVHNDGAAGAAHVAQAAKIAKAKGL